jgi:hypothetical protein
MSGSPVGPTFNICGCEAPPPSNCPLKATGTGVGGGVLMILAIGGIKWLLARRARADAASAASSPAPAQAAPPRRRRRERRHRQNGPPPPEVVVEGVAEGFDQGYNMGEDLLAYCSVM